MSKQPTDLSMEGKTVDDQTASRRHRNCLIAEGCAIVLFGVLLFFYWGGR